ncbi:hypothetical protein ACPZ19_38795 [Amycolatopsis lurida]
MLLSSDAVKDHVSAILTKLRVDSRVRAALVAQRAGLIEDGTAGMTARLRPTIVDAVVLVVTVVGGALTAISEDCVKILVVKRLATS